MNRRLIPFFNFGVIFLSSSVAARLAGAKILESLGWGLVAAASAYCFLFVTAALATAIASLFGWKWNR